ncbi:hypothetical protein A2690_03470 [Candidatus Roizmanbacteria bacterium RIFCSPHIGHO2_01_FULL_39_12b]|uniref:HTH cro/C1-type domain-containing protein n=1 Tax=Candidatus Roizmanbacteria bacterium RIFCSPHIGHO2_01_FULL_39_12b TaxID=1802030 RepID=A0A1F7GDG8_9BACT|nr:MAG: hypothetical protein A2690_03470 [Candidatus Roizmanbacteria bacterium RIFCSPHIGHO2_01_FULL_39_12b]OGK47334.1 MAG: hypothetical protein A3B46_02255 [Candidatus Roizmanbacteria bacterium RIFCSPLOWO2_01_FULL_39_19]
MQTVGQILKSERKRLEYSIEDIEKKTRIRKKYLEGLEQSNWSLFPSKTYILGVLKSYGSLLNLNEEKLDAFFRREYERTDSQKFTRKVNAKQLIPSSKIYMRLGIVFSVLLLALYFGVQLVHLLTPPKVEIVAPINDHLPPRTQKFDLIGLTEKDAIVEINGERYVLNEENQFSAKIPILKKNTKVTINVTGANGKKTTITKIYRIL